MFNCPLATYSDTLWLTEDKKPKWTSLGAVFLLSLLLHALVLLGFGLYFVHNPAPEIKVYTSGTPDLPLKVNLITQSTVAAASVQKPATSEPEKIIPTQEKSVAATTPQKTVVPQHAEKEVISEYANNAAAGTPKVSEHAGLNDAVLVDAKPRYRVSQTRPEYPAQAVRRKQEGVVILHITVEPNGDTSKVNVFRSSGYPLLDASALKEAKNWLLFPYEVDGRTLRGTFSVPVKFELT